MRNINVTKYRKLLYKLQFFCKQQKFLLSKDFFKQRSGTDYENGFFNGKHAAYNEVLRELEQSVQCAEYDWRSVDCREERYSKELIPHYISAIKVLRPLPQEVIVLEFNIKLNDMQTIRHIVNHLSNIFSNNIVLAIPDVTDLESCDKRILSDLSQLVDKTIKEIEYRERSAIHKAYKNGRQDRKRQ